MSLHHGLTDLRDNHFTCFTDMLYSSTVPGNLPSQLEILSTGQNYYEPMCAWSKLAAQHVNDFLCLLPALRNDWLLEVQERYALPHSSTLLSPVFDFLCPSLA